MRKKQLKKSLILTFLVMVVLLSQPVINAEEILPVFDYESTQSFQPDMKTKEKTIAQPEEKKVVEETNTQVIAEEELEKPVQFQLADPKKVYIPGEKVLNPTITIKDEKLTITTKTPESEMPEKVEPEDHKPVVKDLEAKPVALMPDKVDMTLEEEAKKLQEQRQKLEEERIKLEEKLKERELAQKKAEEDKRKAEIERKKQELAQKKAEEKARKKEQKRKAKEAKKQAELAKKLEDEQARKEEEARLAKIEKERLEEEIKAKEALVKEEIKKTEEEKPVIKVDDKKVKSENILVNEEKPEIKGKQEDIDYYLKKYTETVEPEIKQDDLQFSLMDPFKKSLFYNVLKENKYETIELETRDVTADSRPEAVVSYNVPLGAGGEYACQAMVLEPRKESLAKLWVSELIPGEIDTVMVQDINYDAQNDIVVISTTGGVSLLKSIRVYSFDKSKGSFKTIFAMNSIMEGIVSVKSGKILISETFPGGVNRAALYVWNGRRFERLEL